MINYVTKRDGRKEQFSADKLHRWIEMTAKEDVNWSDLAFRAYRKLNDGCSSVDLHNALVMACLDIGTEASLRVAGKFFVSGMYKEVYGGIEKIPHLKEFGVKCWAKMDYSDEEWDDLNSFISHKADLTYSYTTIRQMADKYLIKDRITGELKETPQMAFMGIAMAAMECMNKERRVEDVKKLYTYLKDLKINLPSPMLSNLRTPSKGYASCLTFMTDDTVSSLATGEHIAFMMTAASAGIGGYIQARSIGDSVKGGAVRHIGKIPLYRQIESAVNAMRQQSRGGAATVHFTCLDPEVEDLTQLKNPMTLQEKLVRGIDYSMIYNNSFAKAVATNGKWLLISIKDAPDLYEALFSNDGERFDVLLEKYWDKGKRVMARDVALNYLTQSLETGRMYMYNAQEGNTHTPYKETIYTSNLCQEIQLPTKPFKDMLDLYNSDAEGLMGLCMLAGIVQGRVSDDEYADVAYYCLLVIDNVINMMNYPFPSLETSAKKYRAAGVGITNLAYLMAKEGKSYTSKEGKELIHYVGERHAYHLIKASLKLAKEFGVCGGMEVSKYKDGWLPIDTYNKNVDSVVANNLTFDWEGLRKEIVANGGIRNTVVSAIAPNESSSQLTNTTNSVYAIRQVKIAKSSGNNRNIVIAPESDVLKYDIAWDLSTKDQIESYALLQKWVDQGISGDLFIDRRGGKIIDDRKLLTDFLLQTKLGMKTRYYINSATGDVEKDNDDERGCGSGGCAL